jgi:YHS domain-containing protein
MKFTLVIVAVLATIVGFGQSSQRATSLNVDSDRLALDGFDPVSYFKDKEAVKGKKTISAEVDGVRYNFSTTANKTEFLKSPSSYEPQYGGWCAYAMGAKGEKVEVDPETFKIIEGKLYLFYNRFFNNTLTTWNEDEKNLKAKADKNWIKVSKP